MGRFRINESDFYWVTHELAALANTFAQGRIGKKCVHNRLVSALEGGYNVVGGGLYSPFALSVEAHLRALNDDRGETWTQLDEPTLEREKRKWDQVSQSMAPRHAM